MNKADYTTLINAKIPDGTQLPSSQHRETMHTDANSIIELVYGDAETDNEIREDFTSSTALFDYAITLYKVGSTVTITGWFEANSSLLSASSIFTVTDTDFTGFSGTTFNVVSRKINSMDVMPVYFNDANLRIGASILNGERYEFTINYKALN